MKGMDKFFRTMTFVLLFGMIVTHWSVSAQDALPSRHILQLQFSAAPSGPPTVEPVGSIAVFKIDPKGEVKGDLEGTFTEHITQLDTDINATTIPVNSLQDITTFFSIKTNDGTIEGYFYGAFYFPEEANGDAVVQQHGHVLSVTGAYANLYMADVIYEGVVDFKEVNGASIGVGDSGTLLIAPR
jgi:hypothetical protein